MQADVQCECRFFQASAMAGTPEGYRWDCGILRPRLNYAVPVDLNPYPYPLPEGLSVELPGSGVGLPGSGRSSPRPGRSAAEGISTRQPPGCRDWLAAGAA